MAQLWPAFDDRLQDDGCAVTVLDVGGMDDETNQQAKRIHYDMTLAAHHFLPASKPRIPPLSLVLTDWL